MTQPPVAPSTDASEKQNWITPREAIDRLGNAESDFSYLHDIVTRLGATAMQGDTRVIGYAILNLARSHSTPSKCTLPLRRIVCWALGWRSPGNWKPSSATTASCGGISRSSQRTPSPALIRRAKKSSAQKTG